MLAYQSIWKKNKHIKPWKEVLLDMIERPVIENQIIDIIDRLKGLCHTCGLSNQAAEEEIVTSVFLYKYLSDNYKMQAYKEAVRTGKSITDIFASGVDTEIELKAEDLIDCMVRIMDRPHIADIFDNTLIRIASYPKNKKLSKFLDEPLFKPITKNIEKRDEFVREILTVMIGHNIFSNGADHFAPIFEYLIKDYNVASGRYAEYYTPGEISRIIAKILTQDDKQKNRTIYDPSAGSGSLLLHLANELEDCSIFSQDISVKSTRLLRINMILNGYTDSIPNIKQGDTLLNPYFTDQKYDYIVSNPPFKTDFSFTREDIAQKWENRFPDGLPEIPKKKKESMSIYLCFIQHVLWALNEKGKAAVVVPAGFLNIKDGIEENIRKRLVMNGWLSGVIIMPRNSFANTATKVAVLFIDKSSYHTQPVLMDASELGTLTKIGKNKKVLLSKEDIDMIVHGYFKRDTSMTVSPLLSDIALNGYSFIPGHYMTIKNYQNLLSESEFKQKTIQFEDNYRMLCQQEKESDSDIFSVLSEIRRELC